MTLVLIVKDLVFEGPTPKTKDKWVLGNIHTCTSNMLHSILQSSLGACVSSGRLAKSKLAAQYWRRLDWTPGFFKTRKRSDKPIRRQFMC